MDEMPPPTAKWDGEKPGFGACRQHRTECECDYDDDDDDDDDPGTTPHASLRREYEQLVGRVEGYFRLLGLLRTRPDEEAARILEQLRGNSSVHIVVGFGKEGRLLRDGFRFHVHQ